MQHLKFEEQINKCETMRQIFDVVNCHYNTDQALGIITGRMVKSKIPELVQTLNLKRKNS